MIGLRLRFFTYASLLIATATHLRAEFSARTLHESSDASKAVLKVHAEQRSPYPISRYLTGKFAEHLGANIYGGMDAQVLENPTMGQYPFWAGGHDPDGVVRLAIDEEAVEEGVRSTAMNAGWPESDISNLLRDRKDALATFWGRVGSSEDVLPSPDTGPFGGRAQRLEVKEQGEGMTQWAYLPLHRTRKYEFEVFLRSPNIKSFSIALSQVGTAKAVSSVQMKGASGKWQKFTGTLDLDASFTSNEPCRFSFTADSPGQFVIQRILLRPLDHIHGADPEIVQYLKASRLPILRWPGGNFVSAYHWRDGVGPLEKRPTLPNYAWGRLEPNLFGTDEFMALCEAVGCEPMICVNAGTGTPQEAAGWIEYCNGPVTSPMGKLRAANGHPAPYKVKHWEAGNELWGKWQVNWTTPAGNADRYLQFAMAMRTADPKIELYGCGAPALHAKAWNETLVTTAGERLEGITDHLLAGGSVDLSVEPLDVYRDYMGIPEMLEKRWRRLGQEMSEQGVKSPKLALTELQIYPALGKRSDPNAPDRLDYHNLVNPMTQAEALYDVLIYHTAIRLSPFFDLITHSGTVNHGGGLRKYHEHVYAQPCYYAQSAFAAMAGATPVAIEIECPMEKAPIVLPDLEHAGEHGTFGMVDAIAAISPAALWLSIVQRKSSGAIEVNVELDGTKVGNKADVRSLSAKFPWSSNSSHAPTEVSPLDSSVAVKDGKLLLKLEPYSVVRVRIPRSAR